MKESLMDSMKVLLCLVSSFTDRAECWKIFLKSDEILMAWSFSQFNIWNINKAGEWTVNTIFIDGTVQLNDLLSILWHEFPLKLLPSCSLRGTILPSGLLGLLGVMILLSSPLSPNDDGTGFLPGVYLDWYWSAFSGCSCDSDEWDID